MVTISFRAAETGDTGQAVEAACQPARKSLAGWRLPEGKRATLARRRLRSVSFLCYGTVPDVVVPLSAALILTTAALFCLPGAPSAPGCLAASGR
ncbi:hypothetical protein, partial [Escherichia coli]|uniref:hypothetical protein n=1 Tax=Escherichia coli TaxID=562 RepID=UPI0022E0E24B